MEQMVQADRPALNINGQARAKAQNEREKNEGNRASSDRCNAGLGTSCAISSQRQCESDAEQRDNSDVPRVDIRLLTP